MAASPAPTSQWRTMEVAVKSQRGCSHEANDAADAMWQA
jgi:hypothetical protein